MVRIKFDALDDDKKESFLSARPTQALADDAIRLFAESGSYRTSELRGRNLILPIAEHLDARQVRALLFAAADNAQIWNATQIPEIFTAIVRLTIDRLPDTRPDWRVFLAAIGKRADAFKGLATLVA